MVSEDDKYSKIIGTAVCHMKRMYGAQWGRMHKIRKARV